MEERDGNQKNTSDIDTSFVEIWDRLGPFEDMEQSATRFREFLLDLTSKGQQSNEDLAEQIALLGKSFAEAGRGSEALVSCDFLVDLYDKQESPKIREGIAKNLVSIGSDLLDQG